jgi:L-fuconolactonase
VSPSTGDGEIADAHLHLFRDGYHARYGHGWTNGIDDLARYETLRRAHGIGLGLVVGYEGSPAFAGNNDDLAEWARSCGWLVPVRYLPCVPAPSEAALRDAWSRGFAGISLYVTSPGEAREVACWPSHVAASLRRQRAVVSVNAAPDCVRGLMPFLSALDGCAVLFSHLGLPGPYATPPSRAAAAERLRPLLDAAELPHVGVKLSGLYAVSRPSHDYPHPQALPFIELVAEAFGHRRLYWGSDYSPCLEHVSFAQALDAVSAYPWSPAEREAILGANLRAAVGAAGAG